MQFTYHLRGDRPRQRYLCALLEVGASKNGDIVRPIDGYEGVLEHVDGTILLGIGGMYGGINNRMVFDAYRQRGKQVILFDKGYVRANYWRISINSFQPLSYLMRCEYSSYRFAKSSIAPKGYDLKGDCILFDGASQKYCDWHDLGNQYDWVVATVAKIREYTNRPIVCRLKHTTGNAKHSWEIPGACVSKASYEEDLARAFIVVSHGGNIGFNAVVAGKPHFAIGPSIARPLSETNWPDLYIPQIPDHWLRNRWLHNVCHCQWTAAELQNGTAWVTIKDQLEMCGESYGQESHSETA